MAVGERAIPPQKAGRRRVRRYACRTECGDKPPRGGSLLLRGRPRPLSGVERNRPRGTKREAWTAYAGGRFTTVSKFLGRRLETPFEVTVHEFPRHHSHKSTGGPLPLEWTLTFEEAADGTRVTE